MTSGAHNGVVRSLLSASPAAARIEDGRGMIPLHWAAALRRVRHEAVRGVAEEYPAGLVSASADGDILLHLAVSNATISWLSCVSCGVMRPPTMTMTSMLRKRLGEINSKMRKQKCGHNDIHT